MLYLVSEDLDKARAHYQAETGRFVPLMRGIDANTAMDELAAGIADGLDQIVLPDVPNFDVEIFATAEQMLELCRLRVDSWH
jgi:hypothetical protein